MKTKTSPSNCIILEHIALQALHIHLHGHRLEVAVQLDSILYMDSFPEKLLVHLVSFVFLKGQTDDGKYGDDDCQCCNQSDHCCSINH